MLERLIALFLFILLAPAWIAFFLTAKLISPGRFLFRQKRMGKNRKIFMIYKIRTMVENAERLKPKYRHLNESDGPTFKIHNDPRYTRFGRALSHTGLDELPQLINIMRGEMAFVGPRPLPVEEADKVPAKYRARFSVLPGITSSWVINGSHKLTFKQWMEHDLKDVQNNSFAHNLRIAGRTVAMIVSSVFKLR